MRFTPGSPGAGADNAVDGLAQAFFGNEATTEASFADCNANGIPDVIDIVDGLLDADTNGIPDVCECPADLATPAGVLDIFDVIEYLALFDAQDPAADLAAPAGVFDFFDVVEYLGEFDEGC
ncbi:MAG: GC-type dockerin domain-anchored protein [Planctomycetota bacterium]